jgi:hypothetical protein
MARATATSPSLHFLASYSKCKNLKQNTEDAQSDLDEDEDGVAEDEDRSCVRRMELAKSWRQARARHGRPQARAGRAPRANVVEERLRMRLRGGSRRRIYVHVRDLPGPGGPPLFSLQSKGVGRLVRAIDGFGREDQRHSSCRSSITIREREKRSSWTWLRSTSRPRRRSRRTIESIARDPCFSLVLTRSVHLGSH